MDAATLFARYSKFSQDTLKLGYVDALYSRGLAEGLARLIFKPFKGKSHEHNVNKSRPSGSAARDPLSETSPPSGKGDFHNINIYPGQMLRDFTVQYHAATFMSDEQDQRAIDAMDSAEAFFEEFMQQFFHGDGSYQESKMGVTDNFAEGSHLCGIDWWLDKYCYQVIGGSKTNGPWHNSVWNDQKIFTTSDSLPTHDAAKKDVLGYEHVDRGLMRIKGRKDGVVIISDERSYLRFVKAFRASGGEMSKMHIGEEKVAEVNAYENKPWLISDTAGGPKYATGGTGYGAKILTGDLDTLIVDGTGENSFIGFSDLDIGRVVKIDGADFSGRGSTPTDPVTGMDLADDETLITSYTDRRTVGLLDSAGSQVTEKDLTVKATPVIYILKMTDQRDPTCAIYNGDNVASDNTFGVALPQEYYGSIAGFDVFDLGFAQTKGAQMLYRALWGGNFLVSKPTNAVRISGYKLS